MFDKYKMFPQLLYIHLQWLSCSKPGNSYAYPADFFIHFPDGSNQLQVPYDPVPFMEHFPRLKLLMFMPHFFCSSSYSVDNGYSQSSTPIKN